MLTPPPQENTNTYNIIQNIPLTSPIPLQQNQSPHNTHNPHPHHPQHPTSPLTQPHRATRAISSPIGPIPRLGRHARRNNGHHTPRRRRWIPHRRPIHNLRPIRIRIPSRRNPRAIDRRQGWQHARACRRRRRRWDRRSSSSGDELLMEIPEPGLLVSGQVGDVRGFGDGAGGAAAAEGDDVGFFLGVRERGGDVGGGEAGDEGLVGGVCDEGVGEGGVVGVELGVALVGRKGGGGWLGLGEGGVRLWVWVWVLGDGGREEGEGEEGEREEGAGVHVGGWRRSSAV